jgi:hypothetical protein
MGDSDEAKVLTKVYMLLDSTPNKPSERVAEFPHAAVIITAEEEGASI